MREFYILYGFTGGLKRFIILLLLRCPFDAMYTSLQAVFLMLCFNAINQGNIKKLNITCQLFVIGFFLLFLYNGAVWRHFAANSIRWAGAIRKVVFSHIAKLPLIKIESGGTGEWLTRLNADIRLASAMLDQPIHVPHAAVATVNICVSAVILLSVDHVICTVVMLFLIPHVLIGRFLMTRGLTKISSQAQEAAGVNMNKLNVIVTCAETAALYDAKDYLLESFRISSLNLRKANMKVKLRNALSAGFLPIMGMSGYLTVLYIGAGRISEGTMTFGGLTAALQYRNGILVSTMMLVNSVLNIRTSLAGVRRVNETLSIPLEE